VTGIGLIYHDRAFGRPPILADDLEEAGCQDADILGHGCWPTDGMWSLLSSSDIIPRENRAAQFTRRKGERALDLSTVLPLGPAARTGMVE
jgi:hypothetical protein